jgi:hypothetical protein
MSNDSYGFLAGGGAKAMRFVTLGDTVTGGIAAQPKTEQQRDFATKQPLTWKDGSPKLHLVVDLQTEEATDANDARADLGAFELSCFLFFLQP